MQIKRQANVDRPSPRRQISVILPRQKKLGVIGSFCSKARVGGEPDDEVLGHGSAQSKTITCRAASPLRMRSSASLTSASSMREEIISSR